VSSVIASSYVVVTMCPPYRVPRVSWRDTVGLTLNSSSLVRGVCLPVEAKGFTGLVDDVWLGMGFSLCVNAELISFTEDIVSVV